MDEALFLRLVRESGLPMSTAGGTGRPGVIPLWSTELRKLVALVAEKCAKIADDTDNGYGSGNCVAAGDAIRAKFKAAC